MRVKSAIRYCYDKRCVVPLSLLPSKSSNAVKDFPRKKMALVKGIAGESILRFSHECGGRLWLEKYRWFSVLKGRHGTSQSQFLSSLRDFRRSIIADHGLTPVATSCRPSGTESHFEKSCCDHTAKNRHAESANKLGRGGNVALSNWIPRRVMKLPIADKLLLKEDEHGRNDRGKACQSRT